MPRITINNELRKEKIITLPRPSDEDQLTAAEYLEEEYAKMIDPLVDRLNFLKEHVRTVEDLLEQDENNYSLVNLREFLKKELDEHYEMVEDLERKRDAAIANLPVNRIANLV